MDDLTDEENTELRLALRRALASGHQSVTFRDRTVTYRSVEEMQKILAQLGGGTSFASRRSTATTRRDTEDG